MLKRRGERQLAVRDGKVFWFVVMLSPLVAFLCALPVGCNYGNSSVTGGSCTLDDVTSGSRAIPVADSRSFLKRIPIFPALRNIGSTQRDTPPSPRPHAPACFSCWIFFFSSMLHIYLYASPVAFRMRHLLHIKWRAGRDESHAVHPSLLHMHALKGKRRDIRPSANETCISPATPLHTLSFSFLHQLFSATGNPVCRSDDDP